MKHTPGPWEVATLGECNWGHDCKGHIDVESADGTTITPGPLPMERIADARLIAAAPDLLKALIAIGARLKQKQGPRERIMSWDAILHICETEVAKARP